MRIVSGRKALQEAILLVEGARGVRRAVCVFAPMFTAENERDGYMQRIKSIDETVLGGMLRFYLLGDLPFGSSLEVQMVDEDHISILFDSRNWVQLHWIFRLIRTCGCTYCHSVLRLMPNSVSRRMTKIYRMPGLLNIWDVHGAVPEECSITSDEINRAFAEEVETYLWKNAGVILSVSRAMERHLTEKHGETSAKKILLPIYSPVLTKASAYRSEKRSDPPLVLYSGGLQPWQEIPRMQTAIEKAGDRFRYLILVPDPGRWNELWGNRKRPVSMEVTSMAPDQIGNAYQRCRYGFLLRDDSPINRVACPTKLIDYLSFGIIPVMLSPDVGDFAADGMQYIPLEKFESGQLPSDQEQVEMAVKNRQLIKGLLLQSRKGVETLQKILTEAGRR